MSQVYQPERLRIPVIAAVLICVVRIAWASQAGALLPANTDVVVTFSVREFLQDYRDNSLVQRYLDQWRLAAQGDQTQLLESYESEEIRRYEGITPREFLERAAMIKAAYDALGCDPLQDIDWITFACAPGEQGFRAIIVEGRFPQRNIERLEQFFRQHLFPVNQGDGPSLRLIEENHLVFADSKKTMEALQARTAQAESGLPLGVRTLLESGRKQHLSLVVRDLASNFQRLAKFVDQELAGSTDVDQGIDASIIGSETEWIAKSAADFDAVSFGISARNDQLRLVFGLDSTKAKTAADLRRLIDGLSFLGIHALRAIDHELATPLADILGRQRTLLSETALTIHIDIPNEFIRQVTRNPSFNFFPQMDQGNIAKQTFPGLDEVQSLAREVTSLPLWKSGAARTAYKERRGIPYKSGPGADSFRNRLDMYVPADSKDFPTVVLVHGGGWDEGDNRCAGLYSSVGEFLASQGIGAVLPNYRLSPLARHPEHIQDVAKAVAWTRSHVGEYGGDAGRLFLMGHSAGGHLVSLLATDESFLKAEGMSGADIKGVITVSGIYRISEGLVDGAVGCSGPRALRVEQMLPLRGEFDPYWKWYPPGIHVAVDVFGRAFGDSVQQRADASPTSHVHRNLPPFLIFAAEHDLPMLGPQANDFHAALLEKGCDSRLLHVPKRNHNSVLFSMISMQDPAARAIVEFVRKSSATARTADAP